MLSLPELWPLEMLRVKQTGAKQEGEEQMEPLVDEEVEVSAVMEGTEQHMEYIICFAKAVKFYQQNNRSCFGCRSPDCLMWDCLKDISKSAGKASLNTKDGQ